MVDRRQESEKQSETPRVMQKDSGIKMKRFPQAKNPGSLRINTDCNCNELKHMSKSWVQNDWGDPHNCWGYKKHNSLYWKLVNKERESSLSFDCPSSQTAHPRNQQLASRRTSLGGCIPARQCRGIIGLCHHHSAIPSWTDEYRQWLSMAKNVTETGKPCALLYGQTRYADCHFTGNTGQVRGAGTVTPDVRWVQAGRLCRTEDLVSSADKLQKRKQETCRGIYKLSDLRDLSTAQVDLLLKIILIKIM